MSDYTKTTNFTAKDALPSGDANKKILGSLFDTEFDALAVAIATKANQLTVVGAANNLLKTSAGGDIVEATNISDDGTNVLVVSSAKLGMGTTSPVQAIHIHDGYINFSNPTTGATVTDGSYMGMSSSDLILSNREAGNLRLYTSGTEQVRIQSDGKVGIGTTSPTRELHIHGSTDAWLHITQTDTGTTDNDGLLIGIDSAEGVSFINRETTDMAFRTSNTERMRITSSGTFGIRTTAPDGTFHIKTGDAGAVTASTNGDELVLENSTTCGMSLLSPDANTTNIYFGTPSDNIGALFSWSYTSEIFSIGTQTASGVIHFKPGNFVTKAILYSTGGFVLGSATSGDQGNGTVNAKEYYREGVRAPVYVRLSTPETILSGSFTSGAWTTINNTTLGNAGATAAKLRLIGTATGTGSGSVLVVNLRRTGSGVSTGNSNKHLDVRDPTGASSTGYNVNTTEIDLDGNSDFDYYANASGGSHFLYMYLDGYWI